MDRMIHTALSGLSAAMAAQRVTANNIANASTVGFRRDDAEFAALFLGGAALPGRAEARCISEAPDDTPGALMTTGNPLDIAMTGGAALAVHDAEGGEAWTRRGDLQVGADSTLTTGDGRTVLGDGGPIAVPLGATDLRVTPEGQIEFRPAGGGATERAVLGRLKLATPAPGGLRRGGDGLLRPQGSALPADTSARVVAGRLEASNVNPVAEMVDLMERARRYELQVRMIGGAKELDQSGAALMRVEK